MKKIFLLTKLFLMYYYFRHVEESYSTKKPIIEFDIVQIHAQREVIEKGVIHFNNTSAVWLGRLFEEYDLISPRVRPIVIAFRYFARVRFLKIIPDNTNW